MTRYTTVITFCIGMLLTPPIGCKKGGETTKDGHKRVSFPKGEKGARALINALSTGSKDKRLTLTLGLEPSEADLKALFKNPADAKKMESGFNARLWSKIKDKKWPPLGPSRSSQTGTLVFKATTEQLKGSSNFPGGYRAIAHKFTSGLTFYRFKFVKPGERLGMAYDGLVHVNGHWVIIPKPWRSLR